jgi:hypothetical protein
VSRHFRRHGDAVRMQLEAVEVELLQSLQQGLRAALEGGDHRDPIVRRLFPATVSDDDEADQELRGLIHDDLLRTRLDGLDTLLGLLERGTRRSGGVRVDLVEEEPMVVLGVLNDLRLAIGAQVGIENLDREALDPEDPVTYRVAVMDHLAWLQEQLLQVLDPASTRVHDEEQP